ncbi:MAG: WD40 repeat domain-containing protein, partial [Myxococcota bacterium]
MMKPEGVQEMLAQLREVLHRTPSWRAWFDLCRILDGWPDDEARRLALDYIAEHQERRGWPEPLRRPPLKGLAALEARFSSLLDRLDAEVTPHAREAVARSVALEAEAEGDSAGLALFIWSYLEPLKEADRRAVLQLARWVGEDSPIAWVAAQHPWPTPLRPIAGPSRSASAVVGTCCGSLTTGITPPSDWMVGDAALAAHPDGEQVLVAGPEGIEAWNLEHHTRTLELKHPQAWQTRGLDVHPDGRWLMAAGGSPRAYGFYSQRRSPECTLTLWDTRARKVQAQVNTPCPLAGPVQYLPDGQRVVVLGEYDVAVWDTSTRRWSLPFRRSRQMYGRSYYTWMHLMPNGRDLITARYHHTQGNCPFDELERWDLDTGTVSVEVRATLDQPCFSRVAPFTDGHRLLAQRQLSIWDLDRAELIQGLAPRLGQRDAEPIAVVEGDDYAIVAWSRAYLLVELATGRVVCRLGPIAHHARLLPNHRLAMLYPDRRLVVRDLTPILANARAQRPSRGASPSLWSVSAY